MPERPPEISAICLCYNTGVSIIDTLNSIKHQRLKNFELIVCDDGSQDDSIAIIGKWIKENQNSFEYPIQFIQNQINLGIPRTLNKALAISQGKYYSLIGDDEWHPDYLKSLYRLIIETDDSIALVFADTDVVDYVTQAPLPAIDPIKSIRHHYPKSNELITQVAPEVYRFNRGYLYECFFLFSPVIAFTTLIKTDIVKSMGCYNEAYTFEDLPMWLQIFQKYDCIFLDRKLAKYNKRSHSVSMAITFPYQESILKILLHQLDTNKIDAGNSFVRNKIVNEFYALIQTWKRDKLKYAPALHAITRHCRRYYPSSLPRFLKILWKNRR